MSVNGIIDEIAIIIGEVSDISSDNIHKYIRHVYTPKKFLELFKQTSTNRINAWQITRKASSETRESWNNNNMQHLRTHNILIMGWYSVRDSENSSAEFQDLIEDVCAEIRQKPTLNQIAFECNPPQLLDISFDVEGKVLVHRCVIALKATEYINFSVS